jgi:hypothetical protein
MYKKLCILALAALLPALVAAQQTKLINCRTLEAAGNFVGSDEVLVNNMVCQVVKGGAAAVAAAEKKFQEGPKPLAGATISGAGIEAPSVADMVKPKAKAAEPAANPVREKSVPALDPVAAAPDLKAEPATPPAATPIPVAKPEPIETLKPSAAPPMPVAKPLPNEKLQSPASEVVSMPEPTREAAPAVPSAGAQPSPATASAVSAPAVPVEAVAVAEPAAAAPKAAPSEAAAPPTPASAASAPVSAPEPSEAEAPVPEKVRGFYDANAGTKVVTVAAPPETATTAPSEVTVPPPPPATALSAPIAVPAPREAEAPGPEKVPGFYDANAGTTVVTVAAPVATASPSVGGAEPASPAMSAAPAPAATDTPTSSSPAMAPPDDANQEPERVVQLGSFEKPREETPAPQMQSQKYPFQATEEDGFQEGQRPGCTKNVTLGSLRDEMLVLGTPAWATKWIEKNQRRMPQTCFSDTPMAGAQNYLIVFYTPGAAANGGELTNASLNSLQGTPATGVGAFTTKYGLTWHYAYDRTVGATINSRNDADEPHSRAGQVLYATAYTEEGVPVVQHWPERQGKLTDGISKDSKKIRNATAANERISSDLLSQMVEDILKL